MTTTLIGNVSSAAARIAPSTVAAPLMSNFISSMAGGLFEEIPPESKVIPLPTRQIGALALLAP